ncbi:FecR family protein [Maribacter cobaltidurans]|uniref:Uncharacterized protein n=1 Tax=Maribacter cobaltidurans TaxID=1178778 RepID=A0A223V6I9_9FLAO|nr:FecR family protein [Maribacter cobaltidurans]ASV31035.1 hypothetical protein CJ263_12900 [Maribacter cobaltidurans]GGD96220.1 hypothetical protein GCM10011412_37900 [Maribacter cobaltidurans]
MVSKEIEKSIVKYFTQSADIADLDLLNDWISLEENQIIFKTYVKTNFAINLAMNDPDLKIIKEKIIKEIRKEKRGAVRFRYISVVKYAAIALAFLGISLFLQRYVFENKGNQLIIPRKDTITLQLGNGDIEIITEDGTSKLIKAHGKVVGTQKGKQLVYKDDGTETKFIYNTLSVPNGKRFNVVLSDGTKVYLNSGSSITYPERFVRDSVRRVFLKGEAYFEVAHNDKHEFIVKTEELNVKVYGTKFNITNYPEDENTEIVLLEGSVSLRQSGNAEINQSEFFLIPGYKGTFNKSNKKIVDTKVNTALYTSWMEGNLVFRNAAFEKITQKLERHYNVVIINNNAKLATEKFNATIEVEYETIEQVLNYFNKVYQIEFKIIENKIIIN